MKILKFQHIFSKLWNRGDLAQEATLLQVLPVEMSDITQEMRDYDTDFEKYPLPRNGRYLLLIFVKTNGYGLFTTFRSDTPENMDYYTVGQTFKITFGIMHHTIEK